MASLGTLLAPNPPASIQPPGAASQSTPFAARGSVTGGQSGHCPAAGGWPSGPGARLCAAARARARHSQGRHPAPTRLPTNVLVQYITTAASGPSPAVCPALRAPNRLRPTGGEPPRLGCLQLKAARHLKVFLRPVRLPGAPSSVEIEPRPRPVLAASSPGAATQSLSVDGSVAASRCGAGNPAQQPAPRAGVPSHPRVLQQQAPRPARQRRACPQPPRGDSSHDGRP